MRLRPARRDEAEALRASLTEGFDTYADFAPRGWTAVDAGAELERIRAGLANPDHWFLVAEEDGDPDLLGHTSFRPGDDPAQAHLQALFVRPALWGSGLAKTLHDEAVAEMARRGYATARLYTPRDQARARRFYEREGWWLHGDGPSGPMDLALVEYRRRVP